MSTSAPRFLIVKLSAIGDCLLASPVAQALRESYPEAHIGWVVHPHCAPVVRQNPHLDRVHLWPRKRLFRHLIGVAREIRVEKYDTALDLQGLFKSGLIAKLSGAKRRIGPLEAREGATRFYTESVARQYKTLHVVPGYLELAKAAGASWSEEPPMHMPFGEDELRAVRELLATTPCCSDPRPTPHDPLIVLNPSAGKAIKQWGPDRFGKLGDRLIEERNAQILITGAPADRGLADSVLHSMKNRSRVLDLTGKTNLNQLAALLSQVDLFIGGDTGPMHIAQAAGTRVLAIFGPTDPHILGPRREVHRVATLSAKCSPCRYRECPIGRICLENLEVERVLEQAKEMLT